MIWRPRLSEAFFLKKREGHVKPIKKSRNFFPAQNKFSTTIEAEIETPQLVTE